jgi:hypothetical protein
MFKTFLKLIGSIVLRLTPIRRICLTKPLFNQMRKAMPKMSQTEREAHQTGKNLKVSLRHV